MLLTWYAATVDANKQYEQYPSCAAMALDYPNGIAANWVPQVGPHTVLGEHKGIWRATNVSLINDAAYIKQHHWLDTDGDGILCERLNLIK